MVAPAPPVIELERYAVRLEPGVLPTHAALVLLQEEEDAVLIGQDGLPGAQRGRDYARAPGAAADVAHARAPEDGRAPVLEELGQHVRGRPEGRAGPRAARLSVLHLLEVECRSVIQGYRVDV